MRSFRLALAFRTAAGVLALMLVLAIISAVALRALLYRQLDGTLVHLAEVEAEAGAAQMGSAFQFHEGVLLSSGGGAGAELTRYAELWTSDGAPAARSANLERDLFLPSGALDAAQDGRIRWDTHLWQGQRLRCVVYPLRLVGAAHGQHLLQVAAPLAPLDRTLRDFILSELLLTVLAGGGAFLVGWRIAGAALLPTREITEQAEAIREGTPSPTITAHADAEEFSRLVYVLNGMLGRLDRAFAVQRRFTADASHELRGPLTALRGELDLALKRPRSPDEYRATLERCREEVVRLTSLATDLLTLARLETGLSAQEGQDLDLHVLADRVVDRFRSVAEGRGIRLSVTGASAVVRGDPGMLERLVSNLVDNAVKHAGQAGAVEVAVTAGNPMTLVVRDTGTGVAAADQPHLFSRFFTGESGSAGGTGLGLAIAQSAAKAHGGSLEFLGNDPGAVFQLRLPAPGSQ
jgi:signal transduction histidine kinase